MNEIKHKTIKTSEDVTVSGITLTQREDGAWAIPGGGHVTNKGYAVQIAKSLAYNHQSVVNPIAKLADKIVTRIECSMRDDRSIMGA